MSWRSTWSLAVEWALPRLRFVALPFLVASTAEELLELHLGLHLAVVQGVLPPVREGVRRL